jgi:Holliday junction resolvase RusA-like endonuclease
MLIPNVIVIEGELYSSKNSRFAVWSKRKGLKIVKSANASRQFSELCWQLQAQKKAWDAMIAGLEYPLRVSFKIYRQTDRRFDYLNIIQNLVDAMVKMKYLPDDSAKFFVPFFEPYEIDRENPRTILSPRPYVRP